MWQILILFYFVFGGASYLLRRVLAQKFSHHNRLINATFFVFFLTPTGIILGLLYPHNLNIGTVNFIFLLGGSVIWPIFNIFAFRANREVDAGIFSLVNSLSPIFTLAVAVPFLGERPKPIQYLGIALLVTSGIIAVASQLRSHVRTNAIGITYCLLSTTVLGVAVAYERFMLNRVDFGTYILLGWGAQIAWMALLTGREWRHLPHLVKSAGLPILVGYGATNALKSVCFIVALLISGSASLIGAATDFMSVTVIIAAYFFLNEREHLVQKACAAAVGITGLLLLSL